MSDSGLTRRGLLGAAMAGTALACSSDRPKEGFLGLMERWNERVQRGLLSTDGESRRPSDSELTPEEAFPTYYISMLMPKAPADWKLSVGGKVERPQSLSLDDLQRMTRTDTRIEHHCVEGWSAVADWHGVRLSELAERAGADPRARFVEFRSFDTGYFSSWDRDSAMHKQTLIAYGMNGRDLSAGHGAPARLYGAVKLGYKNVKYLTEVNFIEEPSGGTWEGRGYEWYAGT